MSFKTLIGVGLALALAHQAQAQVVARDADTGQLRAATPDEITALHLQSTSPSQARQGAPLQGAATGTGVTQHADGSKHVRLGKRSLAYSVVTVDADGQSALHCVFGEGAAHATLHDPVQASKHNEEQQHESQ